MNKAEIKDKSEGLFLKVRNGCKLFVYDYRPTEDYKDVLFILTGITGINYYLH
jgi:hypothetical protein